MAQQLVFAPPTTEEMTGLAINVGSAGVTGLAEGVIVKMAPAMGALEPVLTWGTLLGWPAIGLAGGLLTRGMIADVFKGIAAGGAAILGYSLPALVTPFVGKKAEQGARQISGSELVKQLPPGPAYAPQRAQAQVKASLEI